MIIQKSKSLWQFGSNIHIVELGFQQAVQKKFINPNTSYKGGLAQRK